MAKVTPILWKHKTNKEGRHPIYLRIADTSRTRYVSIGEHVLASEWNDRKGEVRAGHAEAEDINERIASEVAKVRAEMRRLKNGDESVSADKLKKHLAIEEKKVGDFLAYARKVIAGYKKRDQIASHIRLTAIFNKLEEYQKKKHGTAELPFDSLTAEYLRNYRDYLSSKHGNKPNTIAKDLKGIRTILYTAIKEDQFEQGKNPFFKVKISERPAKKERLSMKEIAKLEAVDLTEGSALWHARNYFLFSLYMSGIRFGDVARLKWEHVRQVDGEIRLHYKMSKTQEAADLLIIPPAARVLDLYAKRRKSHEHIFPILDGYAIKTHEDYIKAKASQNVLVNGCLKELQKLAAIETPIRFHTSRHSFADLARKSGLWSIYDISKALGHSSLKQTEGYLASFDNDGLDAKRATLFGGGQ